MDRAAICYPLAAAGYLTVRGKAFLLFHIPRGNRIAHLTYGRVCVGAHEEGAQ